MSKAKELPAIPVGARDRPRGCGKRLAPPPLPFEAIGANGDGVFDPLPIPDQPGARHRSARIGHHRSRRAVGDLVSQRIQRAPRLAAQPTERQFLQAIAKPQLQVPPAGIRGWHIEDGHPLCLQLRHRHCPEPGCFGLNIDGLHLVAQSRLCR